VRATGAAILATGNIGCMTQLEAHLAGTAAPIAVRHTLEVLDSAYSAPDTLRQR
jgi:glycolate oxidase iron-sulfur subunit